MGQVAFLLVAWQDRAYLLYGLTVLWLCSYSVSSCNWFTFWDKIVATIKITRLYFFYPQNTFRSTINHGLKMFCNFVFIFCRHLESNDIQKFPAYIFSNLSRLQYLYVLSLKELLVSFISELASAKGWAKMIRSHHGFDIKLKNNGSLKVCVHL